LKKGKYKMPFSYHTKVGERFGSRVITGFATERDTDGHLRCEWTCDCGNEGVTGLKMFRHTDKCPQCRNRNQKGRPTHGQAGGTSRDCNVGRTHLYQCWANMRQRTNPRSAGPRNRKWYADKGIVVCPEWRTFEGFCDWALAYGYHEGLSLDRIFNNGDYEPSNCEWVTRSENSRRSVEDKWRNHRDIPIGAVLGFGS
jgi:hypothetical protein